VSLIVRSDQMLRVVDHLRAIGSTGIVVLPVHYVFGDRSDAFTRLQAQLVEDVKGRKR
jgi:ATP phosphoribosyltransferase